MRTSKSQTKATVVFVIHKIHSIAPQSTLETLGPLTISFVRGSANGTTKATLVNTELNNTFSFVSTFIRKSSGDSTYRDKELQVNISQKKKEIHKFSINLSPFYQRFTQSNVVPQNHDFTYQNIPLQLTYSLTFNTKSNISQTISTITSKPSTIRQLQHPPSPLSKSSPPPSSKNSDAASTHTSNTLGSINKDFPSQTASARSYQNSGSFREIRDGEIQRRGHSRVRSAISGHVQTHSDASSDLFPASELKLLDDVSHVALLMQIDAESSIQTTTSLYSSLLFTAGEKLSVFGSNSRLAERILRTLNAEIDNELMGTRQSLYLFAALLQTTALLTISISKNRSIPAKKFLVHLRELLPKLYKKLFQSVEKKVKIASKETSKNRFTTANSVITVLMNFAEDVRITKIPEEVWELLSSNYCRLLCASIVEEVVNPVNSLCKADIGMNIIMFLGYIEEYCRKEKMFEGCGKEFVILSEVAKVLLLNDKTCLNNDESRRNICPHLGLGKLTEVLSAVDDPNGKIKSTISSLTMSDFIEFYPVVTDYYTLNEKYITSFLQNPPIYSSYDFTHTPLKDRPYFN
ncbi:Dilute domain-containing protein [Entamoeba marina]